MSFLMMIANTNDCLPVCGPLFKMFDDKELKRLLKWCLPTTVLDARQRAGEKVGRKGKKVVAPSARVAF